MPPKVNNSKYDISTLQWKPGVASSVSTGATVTYIQRNEHHGSKSIKSEERATEFSSKLHYKADTWTHFNSPGDETNEKNAYHLLPFSMWDGQEQLGYRKGFFTIVWAILTTATLAKYASTCQYVFCHKKNVKHRADRFSTIFCPLYTFCGCQRTDPWSPFECFHPYEHL